MKLVSEEWDKNNYRQQGTKIEIEYVTHDGFSQAVEAQPNSLHKVRVTTGFGHVPTNYASPANDFVDEFINEILATNPSNPFN